MPGDQPAQGRFRTDPLAGPHCGLNRLVTGPQTSVMFDRHHRSARQHPGVHHGARTGDVDGLARFAGKIDAAMAPLPVRSGCIETAGDLRRLQRPKQPHVIGPGR